MSNHVAQNNNCRIEVEDDICQNGTINQNKVILDELLRERKYGVFEGEMISDWLRETKKNKDFVPEGSETLQQVEQRAIKFLDNLLNGEQSCEEKHVLVVAHGFYLNILFKYFSSEFGCMHSGYALNKRLLNASRSSFDILFPECKEDDWKDGAVVKCCYYNVSDS